MKGRIFYIVVFFLFLLHLPFLSADPGKDVDIHTRGAWTDEGLYAAQARNFVHYGSFGMKDNTTLIRGPLLNLIQVPFFFTFGTSLLVARLVTLMWIVLILIILMQQSQFKYFVLFLVVISFTHFRIFHFSHYAMAEMMAVGSVLLSFLFLQKYISHHRIKHLFLSVLMVYISLGLKIQFAYLVFLPFAVLLIFNLIELSKRKLSGKQFWNDLIYLIGTNILLVSLYAILWYLPNREFFNQVMFEQTHRRFEVWEGIHWTIDFNINYFILDNENIPLIVASALGFLIWMLSFIFGKLRLKNHLIVLFGFIWLLIEFHKLGMTYLPQRYLLGLYMAAGFFSSAVLYQLIPMGKKLKYFMLAGLIAAMVFNGTLWYQSYRQRTWELQKANQYVAAYKWKNKTIAGVWAPAISWGTRAKVIPVWKGFNHPGSLFKNQDPAMLVLEPDEAAVESFFKNNGYVLSQISDSSRYFDAWRYGIVLYWMNQENSDR